MKSFTDLISGYYAAFNAKSWESFFEYLHEDVAHDLNQGKRENGKTQFKKFMERMNRCYDERLENIQIMVNHDGSRAASEYIVVGKYLNTDTGLPPAKGQTYRLPGSAIFERNGDKIIRVTNYYNLQDWLDQIKG